MPFIFVVIPIHVCILGFNPSLVLPFSAPGAQFHDVVHVLGFKVVVRAPGIELGSKWKELEASSFIFKEKVTCPQWLRVQKKGFFPEA